MELLRNFFSALFLSAWLGRVGSAGWLDKLEIRLNSAQLELELGKKKPDSGKNILSQFVLRLRSWKFMIHSEIKAKPGQLGWSWI